MRGGRRGTTWLALLAVMFYGLAPTLASFTRRNAAPLSCIAAAVHTCSCKPDPHAESSCCCAQKPSDGERTIGKLPCSGEPQVDGGLWTAGHQPSAPRGVSVYSPARFSQPAPRHALQALRVVCLDHVTPPPRNSALG